jgi:integrase
LPANRFYDMQHSAVNLLLSSSFHAKKISQMHGHSMITLSLGTYSHIIPTTYEDAAAIDAILSA